MLKQKKSISMTIKADGWVEDATCLLAVSDRLAISMVLLHVIEELFSKEHLAWLMSILTAGSFKTTEAAVLRTIVKRAGSQVPLFSTYNSLRPTSQIFAL